MRAPQGMANKMEGEARGESKLERGKSRAADNSNPDEDQLPAPHSFTPALPHQPRAHLVKPWPAAGGGWMMPRGTEGGRQMLQEAGRQVRRMGGGQSSVRLRPLSQAAPRSSRGRWSRFIGAQVEISPSVAGTAAEERPVAATRSRPPVSRRLLPAVMSNYIHVPPGSPEVPKLDITVSEREGPGCRQGALQLLRRLRPHWRPEEVTLQVRRGPRPARRGGCGGPVRREGGEGQARQGEGGRPLCGGAAALFPRPPSLLPPLSAAAPCAEPHLLGGGAGRRSSIPGSALLPPHRPLPSSSHGLPALAREPGAREGRGGVPERHPRRVSAGRGVLLNRRPSKGQAISIAGLPVWGAPAGGASWNRNCNCCVPCVRSRAGVRAGGVGTRQPRYHPCSSTAARSGVS